MRAACYDICFLSLEFLCTAEYFEGIPAGLFLGGKKKREPQITIDPESGKKILKKHKYNRSNTIFCETEINDDNTIVIAKYYTKEFKMFDI